MKNRDYWKRRFEILEQASVNRGQNYLITLDREYMTAMKRVEGELSTWYQRFAGNNGITLEEAKQWLNKGQLAEFKWSVQDYIKYGEENALNGQWMKQLENASAKVHVSRLEALQIEMQQNIEVLYGNQLDGLDGLTRKIYSDGYYHTAFEVQKGFNIGWDLTPLNQHQLDRVISKPWTLDKETFSDRIWNQKNALVAKVQTELTQSLLRGDSPDKAIKAISEQFKVSKNQAGRLVMTESAYFASESQKDCFNSLDVERFEIVATLDSHTSELCQSLDGHIEEMKNFEAGVTAPPFHPWCRTTSVPYFEDNFGERAARGADGKTYYVPSDMKYEDWKKTFVQNGSKEGLQEVNPSDMIKDKTFTEKIQAVKERIAQNGGKITEEDIHEAGEALRSEVEASHLPQKKAWEDAKTAYAESDAKKRIDELEAVKSDLYEKYNNAPYGEPRSMAYSQYQQARRDWEVAYNAPEADQMRRVMRETQKAYEGTWEANSDELKSWLESFRNCGTNGRNLNLGHYSNRGTLRDVVTQAYDRYPSDWLDASIAKGSINVSKVNRGFYDGRTIAISGNRLESQISTAFHELGHRFEDVIPGLKEAEKAFYNRRTAGESLQWLGSGYSRSEMTRRDKFIHKYMGKTYNSGYYELASMGFDYAYTNPTKLLEDEDFAQFIYGLLSLF